MLKNSMLKIMSVVLVLLLLLSAMPLNFAFAENNYVSEVSDFEYTIENDAVTITGYTGNDEYVKIPELIENLPVKTIGNDAFNACESLKDVVIPTTVSSIGDYAFMNCKGLEKAIIPDSVTSTGYYVFLGCENVTEVKISENLTYMYGTFAHCTSLETATLPEKLEAMDCLFEGCSSLKSIVIPDSVKCIGSMNFLDCTSLTEIVIPEGVERIERVAFGGCSNLVDVTIPVTLTFSGMGAFKDCRNLENVHISDIVAWCNIDFVYDPIYNYSSKSNPLYYADNLYIDGELVKDVVLPEGHTKIPADAFDGTSIESITIPSTLKEIGFSAFNCCENLKSVYVSDLAAWCNIDVHNVGPLFYADDLYLNGDLIKDVVIPDGVAEIPYYAFASKNIESVSIPASVEKINTYAFRGCTKLKDVVIPATVTEIGYNVFDYCVGLENIYYLGTKAQWYENCLDPENYDNVHFETTTPHFDEGEIIIKSTCLTEGEIKYTCPCGVEKIASTPKSDHIYGNDNMCDYCGYLNEEITVPSYTTPDITEVPTVPDTTVTEPTEPATEVIEPTEPTVIETEPTDPAFPDETGPVPTDIEDPVIEPTTAPEEDYKDPSENPEPELNIAIDEESRIEVELFNEKVDLRVKQINENTTIENINFILAGEKVNKLFNISLWQDGKEFEFEDMVRVRIPAENENSKVYRVEPDGTLTDLQAQYINGYLEFSTVHFSLYVITEPIYETGDVNLDGKVNIKDATAIQKYVAKLIEFDDLHLGLADYNSDAKINVKDATTIQKKIAGLI